MSPVGYSKGCNLEALNRYKVAINCVKLARESHTGVAGALWLPRQHFPLHTACARYGKYYLQEIDAT